MEDDDETTVTSKESLHMTTISRHSFSITDQTEKALTIQIIENMKEDYGLFVWPCSIALAEYVWQQRLRFAGTSVVELGAGTSLPGLVAAKVGAEVTLTDSSNRVEVLKNMRRMCDLNKVNCKVNYHLHLSKLAI
uniref:Methyltransferase-like protein 23 n=1 Tax=Nelumbo nucifera TaxID=4432 RepID=A0A822ZKX1_NELNU|nr:TPA_asm: hypothetical protein HUJ06_016661 [Nelumbo nucifera]